MGEQAWWEAGVPKQTDRSAWRIKRMTLALFWLRGTHDAFVIFNDAARSDRYVQFARGGSGAATAAIEVAVAEPVLAMAAVVSEPRSRRNEDASICGGVLWPPFFGEADHEPLCMEVGSGFWKAGRPIGLGADETVVAHLASIG